MTTTTSYPFLAHYPFMRRLGRTINSGEARAIFLTGNIQDLYLHQVGGDAGQYVPLVPFLERAWTGVAGPVVIYELNGPIRFAREDDRKLLRNAWTRWKTGLDANELEIQRMLRPSRTLATEDSLKKGFDQALQDVVGQPTKALEVLRQLSLCARTVIDGARLVPGTMTIIIEGADLILPESEVARLSDGDRHRMYICYDWFSDPAFLDGNTAVVLVAESRSQVNHRIARLPQVMEVAIPAPDQEARTRFINWFNDRELESDRVTFWSSLDDVARYTAGLSLQALRQLLLSALHQKKKQPDYTLSLRDVTEQVQAFIRGQLGEEVVDFLQPEQTFADVIGCRDLLRFLREEFIPRIRDTSKDALSGAAVSGPLGAGKTFVFEAAAGELGIAVLTLKNLRSKWFGETDVIFERLRRVLESLSKVLIVIDEADTQFGGVGADTHETERRLTGKLQNMMSDRKLRGKVHWLLMTARIHLLSPDLRRPGRVGSLIIPVLDPEGEDLNDFIRWTVAPAYEGELDLEPESPSPYGERFRDATKGYSAASFELLRSELKARMTALGGRKLTIEEVFAVAEDLIPPAIGATRAYQILQALWNCTRKSLLPEWARTQSRDTWAKEIGVLEAAGIR